MRFLLDQGLPWSAATLLTERWIPTQHVTDLGWAAAADEAILQFAAENDFVVVTLDADFHTLLAGSGAARPSVIRIRQEGLRGPQVADLLARVIEQVRIDLERGAAVTVRPGRVGVRALPILP
ncbi:MAG: DUF5615 family PIN-like protein [Planctomycetia bacterium]|nr:DUF5615 family PIN-like protein [Planctomycetia bacterium]